MSYASDCTRVYTVWGKMAHLLPPDAGTNAGYAFTLCHRQPRLFSSWLGTGSQYEYEYAAQLPLCRKCDQEADYGLT